MTDKEIQLRLNLSDDDFKECKELAEKINQLPETDKEYIMELLESKVANR